MAQSGLKSRKKGVKQGMSFSSQVQIKPSFLDFTSYIDSYCKRTRHKFYVHNKKRLTLDGDLCGGYCDLEEAHVAGKNSKFYPTLVHEFGHVQQTKTARWAHHFEESEWEDFLGSEARLNGDLIHSALNVLELERDCERRALNFIKRFSLPIDSAQYAREANCYLVYYHFLLFFGSWKDSTKIYRKEIVESMPDKLFTLSEIKKVDLERVMLYYQYL